MPKSSCSPWDALSCSGSLVKILYMGVCVWKRHTHKPLAYPQINAVHFVPLLMDKLLCRNQQIVLLRSITEKKKNIQLILSESSSEASLCPNFSPFVSHKIYKKHELCSPSTSIFALSTHVQLSHWQLIKGTTRTDQLSGLPVISVAWQWSDYHQLNWHSEDMLSSSL